MSLHIVHLVCGEGFGGVERHIVDVANGLTERGCAVTVVGGDPAAMPDALEPGGARWLLAPDMRRALKAVRSVTTADLVHSHMTQADIVASLATAVPRRPFVSTRHFGHERGSSFPARLAGGIVDRRAAAQIAISRFVAEQVRAECVVIPTGVRVRDTDAVAAREPVVLLAQRLEAEKATDVAVAAWAASRGPASGWRLRIAGRGALEADLRAQVAALGVDESVEFIGFADDMDAEYARASILLAPTPHEGLGLTVLEAMAHGVAVVAAAAGGHLETAGGIDPHHLFAPGDHRAAAEHLDVLIADDRARTSAAEAARRHQQAHFSTGRQVEATLALYRRIV